MPDLHFKALLTENGWLENVCVRLDQDGILLSLTPETEKSGEIVNGFALPGFQNAHSHAFQYAMAGLAELHEGNGIPDDFWSWRTAMYKLALSLSPGDMEAIATSLYSEMARHGYTSVTEFHYVHHDRNGKPYSNLAEMGERLISAAKNAGIRITLAPMFYQMGGFGQVPSEQQRRFISATTEDYYKLLDASAKVCQDYKGASLATGIHSLRAVKAADIMRVTNELAASQPFHIHVSEQLREIEDSMAFLGKRPVQWLLDHCNVGTNYHLVHATHLDDNEISGMAKAGAQVVLCPSTEGNLGDGLFRFADFQRAGGRWSIGTDSHIGLNPFEELRILDYGQRLITHKRTTFYKTGAGDSGFNAIREAWFSGRKAMGENDAAFFSTGKPFDALVMDAEAPLAATAAKNRCNTFVYASDVSNILGTIVNGKWIVKNGQHRNRTQIQSQFARSIAGLLLR